jgi:hypothetical protein
MPHFLWAWGSPNIFWKTGQIPGVGKFFFEKPNEAFSLAKPSPLDFQKGETLSPPWEKTHCPLSLSPLAGEAPPGVSPP